MWPKIGRRRRYSLIDALWRTMFAGGWPRSRWPAAVPSMYWLAYRRSRVTGWGQCVDSKPVQRQGCFHQGKSTLTWKTRLRTSFGALIWAKGGGTRRSASTSSSRCLCRLWRALHTCTLFRWAFCCVLVLMPLLVCFVPAADAADQPEAAPAEEAKTVETAEEGVKTQDHHHRHFF